jgi:hypothetical protein
VIKSRLWYIQTGPSFLFDDGHSGLNPYENVLDPKTVGALTLLFSGLRSVMLATESLFRRWNLTAENAAFVSVARPPALPTYALFAPVCFVVLRLFLGKTSAQPHCL